VADRRRRTGIPVDYWTEALTKLGLLSPITEEATQTSATPEEAKQTVTGEMKIFAERLIYTLCPPEKGYAPIIVKTVKSIYDVLEGRKDFGEWFTEVRQALSLKSYQLAQIVRSCLEGLRSKEAAELRGQWDAYIMSELRGYGLLG
jgi:hypothetical protein